MGEEGTAFIDTAKPARPPPRRCDRMKSLLWHHLPCNDAQAAGARRGARRASRPSPGCCACAGWAMRSDAARFLNPSLDHLHDPFMLADMDRAVAAARARARAARADRDPRRLRRRRHHLDGHPAARARDARRGRRPLHPRAAARRLRAAAGGDRAAARRAASRSIVSVDCGIRGTEAARRARELGRRPDHHRSSRAGRRRCRPRWP